MFEKIIVWVCALVGGHVAKSLLIHVLATMIGGGTEDATVAAYFLSLMVGVFLAFIGGLTIISTDTYRDTSKLNMGAMCVVIGIILMYGRVG